MRTGWADGSEFVTQCPIHPGQSYTYRFNVDGQEGTLWWHTRSSCLRATVYGTLIIYPKQSAPYPFSKPKGETPVLLSQWWDAYPIDVINEAKRTGVSPNISDAYTINSQPGDLYKCSSKDTVVILVDSGETILLLNQQLFFTVANHKMTVVGADALYLKPFTTSIIMLGPGQTTDVLVKADQTPGSYHIAGRAYASAQNAPFENTTTTAILQYQTKPSLESQLLGVGYMNPFSQSFNTRKKKKFIVTCLGTSSILQRYLQRHRLHYQPQKSLQTSIGGNLFFTVSLGLNPCPRGRKCQGPNGTRFTASMNNVSFILPSTFSLLQEHDQDVNGMSTTDFPGPPPLKFDYTGNVSRSLWTPTTGSKLYKLKYGARVQIVLQVTSIFTIENHPIHLHGNNFNIIAEGFGNFNANKDTSKFNLVDTYA